MMQDSHQQVNCVQFHNSYNKMKIKGRLQKVDFYQWNLDIQNLNIQISNKSNVNTKRG